MQRKLSQFWKGTIVFFPNDVNRAIHRKDFIPTVYYKVCELIVDDIKKQNIIMKKLVRK